jgi:hypothetical protein
MMKMKCDDCAMTKREKIDAAKVEAIVDVLKDALPKLVTIAFTRFKAELPRIVPGLADEEWGAIRDAEDQRRARAKTAGKDK